MDGSNAPRTKTGPGGIQGGILGVDTPVDEYADPGESQVVELVFEFRGTPTRLWYRHVKDHTSYDVNDIHRTVIASVPMGREVRLKVVGLPRYKISLEGIQFDGSPQPAVPFGQDGADVSSTTIAGLSCGARPFARACFTAIARSGESSWPTLIGDPLIILVPKQGAC